MNDETEILPVVIETRTDGPFLVKNLKTLKDAKGHLVETKEILALCRCGGSANKPFCDGKHKENGYSGVRENQKPLDSKRAYEGSAVTIFDNRTICCHAAYCVEELSSVFRKNEKPWIDADGAGADEIAGLIDRCPSGALSHALKGSETKTGVKAAVIEISANGPYHVSGNVSLQGEQTEMPTDPHRFALCRCGASRNKPFCDGRHSESGFKG